MYGYEWTEENGIFRLTIDAKIQKEIRPVFKEELDFFHMDEYWDYPDTKAPLLWAEGVRRYVLNGVCIAEAQGGSFYERPTIHRLTEERLKLIPIDVEKLYNVNQTLLRSLEQRAIAFIREQFNKYIDRGYSALCSFSGGKDSIVLLDLCAKALAPNEFSVIFSNTGMELSDTLLAVEKAKNRWPDLHFYEAKSHIEATDTWDEFGPPGRRMRWCCTVHKSVPALLKMRELIGSYNARAIVFDGVRAEESARRAKYEEVSDGAKNISQTNCSPILKWNTAELYCHILHNNLLFNDAYRIGLFRVGCMVCPLSSDWWDGIANEHYHEEMLPFLSRIEDYAKRTKPEKEVKKYIEDGGWKARMGGRGLPNGGNRVEEQIANNELVFTIVGGAQKWKNVSPIVGVRTEENGNHGIQKIDNISYEYHVEEDSGVQTIRYKPYSRMGRQTISHLRGVANKTAFCKGCKACTVQCPTGAFTIQPNGNIHIRENLCCHCYNCLTFCEKSCLLAKSLCTTQGGSNMDMKGMNPYQHFGFRQAWLEHFMNDGIACFDKGVLGNRQYDALKVWLKDAGIINNKGKALDITPLGDKLKHFGPYNPFTWAIIWANLSYESVICKWYCKFTEIGSSYEKGDLVILIGDNYTKSTRDNAVTALLETLRFSPIGSSLQQGIPIPKSASTFSYLRDGWDTPDAVALLYSLYLYAEHTRRYSFTLTDLVKAHGDPDSPGVSPGDIYGLDTKKLRDCIQGLALSFPEQIRVSFINDLDNIVLDPSVTSLSLLDLMQD